jgi:hypothetical protein
MRGTSVLGARCPARWETVRLAVWYSSLPSTEHCERREPRGVRKEARNEELTEERRGDLVLLDQASGKAASA